MAAYPDLDDVFKALADPTRRALLDSLMARKGQTLRELCAGTDMARQSVSKHLAVLEAANLVTSVRRGREKLHYVNAKPINDIAERWISRYHQPRVRALAALQRRVEDTTMDTPEFVYTSYIRTTPEQLWRGLTDPAFTSQYWDTTFDTDWQPGSRMVWNNHGVLIDDPEQVVLEAEPYTRLSYTWHTFTPELGARFDFADELTRTLGAERRSKVTFEIEPQGEVCKLTVVHDGFDPGSTAATMVSQGWPHVISDLKTLLETGSLRAAELAAT
jgi:DNA-binding transcriptional ArsR family regulator/uncharacterized protein YndB with AHSA1/START domain